MAYPSGGLLKILVSSINFAPDHAGIAVYSTDFAEYLAEQGNQVNMVTGFPYYPRWKKHQKDEKRYFQREIFKKVNVFRGYLYVPTQVTTLKRLWHELSFCLFASLNFLRVGRPDIIVLFTPPFFLGVTGVLAKWLWNRPLVINIQDLPIDAALALGMMKKGFAARVIQILESWVYQRADLVTTISPAMLDNVRSKGVANSRLSLIPNWINMSSVVKTRSKGQFLAQYPKIKDKFTVVYAGNLGKKQGVDILIYLAHKMQENETIHFFIVGDGADKPRLLKLAKELNVTNITFLPFMPLDKYQIMLSDVDIVFVAQRNNAGNNFFPSKLLGLMAQEKTLLVTADMNSELATTITKAGCGLVSPYGDIPKLKSNLNHLLDSPEALSIMGKKGLEVVKMFDRTKVLSDWYSHLRRLNSKNNKDSTAKRSN